jgi:hypothetical protein
MVQPHLDQQVIEAAKDVDRIWRNDGPHVPHFSTALALLSRSISKLRLYREGRREEEAIQEGRL